MSISSIGCLKIDGTHVAANNSTSNNVITFLFQIWKIVYYDNN